MVVDSHCHLDYDVFEEDREEMMNRASAWGINYMVTIGVQLEKMDSVLQIAKKYPHVFASAGIHPHHALEAPEDSYQQLVKLAQHPKVIGLGETGLDYFYNKTGYDKQEQQFRYHIDVARQFDLPVIVHTRDAEDDTIRILQDEMKRGSFKILIHCFSGSQELARHCLDLGAYLSISGIITFKNADNLRDVVRDVSLSRILVETDAPYLAPLPHRGKRNEPAYTKYNLEVIASLHNISYEEADKHTTNNFFTLFTKASDLVKMQKHHHG